MITQSGSSHKKKKITVIVAVISLIAIYFVSANVFFPQVYLSLVQQYPRPEITNVRISNSSIPLGRSFEMTIVGANKGATSDMQTLSVSFPNMTSTDGITVKEDNFTQHPRVINKGQEIGSHYQGTQYPIYSLYPMIESYNRPWDSGTSHLITIDVTPDFSGRFVVLIKSVCLPNSETIHYPTSGVLDQQSEYSITRIINVTKP